MLQEVSFTEEEVFDAIIQLNLSKSLFSEHLKSSCSVIAFPLSPFFTAIIRHDHMPQLLRDSTLVLVHKNKDASVSANYHPIALSSTLSNVLEQLILCKYSNNFTISHLQFGFKPASSTSLCTGMIKNIVPRCIQNDSAVLGCLIHNGSSVFSCFLDVSKAFDLVDHCILFKRSLWLLLDFCCLGIVLRSVVFIGVHVLDLFINFLSSNSQCTAVTRPSHQMHPDPLFLSAALQPFTSTML